MVTSRVLTPMTSSHPITDRSLTGEAKMHTGKVVVEDRIIRLIPTLITGTMSRRRTSTRTQEGVVVAWAEEPGEPRMRTKIGASLASMDRTFMMT